MGNVMTYMCGWCSEREKEDMIKEEDMIKDTPLLFHTEPRSLSKQSVDTVETCITVFNL